MHAWLMDQLYSYIAIVICMDNFFGEVMYALIYSNDLRVGNRTAVLYQEFLHDCMHVYNYIAIAIAIPCSLHMVAYS